MNQEEQRLAAEFKRLKAARTAAQDGLHKNWSLKAKTRGLQKAVVLNRIKQAVDQLRVALGVKVVPVEEEDEADTDDIMVVLDDDEEESVPNIPREKSKLDALIQTEIATVVDGVLEGVAPDDLNKIKDWIPKLRAVLVDLLRTEHQFDLCRSDLRRVQRMIAKRTGEEHPTAEGPFVRTKPWLSEHTVDLASGKVRFPKYYYARAGKQVFGEWTTGSGKVLAFHHFVHLVRDRPLYAFKIIRTGPAPAPAPAAAADGNCERLHQPGIIPPAEAVLRCVYQQWSHLGVWSKPSDSNAVVRVEGKQPMRKTNGVYLDDVYMAFTVGLQWIAKFTRLVPTDDERAHLVDYMRNVRGQFHTAMQNSLRSASRMEVDALGNEIREDDAIVPLAPGPGIMPAPVTTKQIDALVVVGALVRRVALVTHSLYATLRRTILAHAVCGHRTHGGYVLSIRTIQRESFPAKTWKALVVQELVRMGSTPVTHVEKLFARSTQTMRLVCLDGPGPRYAWPATDQTLKRMRRGDFCDRTFAHAVKVVDGLRVLTAAVLRDYGPSHPLFAAPSLTGLLDYTLQRMLGIMRECADVMRRAPRDVLRVCQKKGMDEMCTLFLERPPDPPHPPNIPMCLLLGTGIMSEDILFLRRLQAFNRVRLLRVMHQQAVKQWTVDTRPLQTPQLDCRVSTSDRTDWKQAYRTMWPSKFESMATTGKRSVSTYMLLQMESPLS